MIAHNCAREDFEPVHVAAGRPCPNGCGWVACNGDLEEFAVKEARAALDLWGPWLKLSEAAAQSGISFVTIAQAARDGRLPTLQLGRQKFVRLSAVQAACSATRGRPKKPIELLPRKKPFNKRIEMDKEELKKALTFEYYATLAANPNWKKTLAQFLRKRMKPYRKPSEKAK